MLSFEIVGYAPRSARDWYRNAGGGRGAADATAQQLMGESPLFRGVRRASALTNQELVGVSVWGAVVLVIWSGTPETALRWDRLEHDPACQRFSVSVTPAGHAMEARWEDGSGRILRHVVISDGDLVTNAGKAHLVDGEDELPDPLADLSGDLDPDELAAQVVETWFRISLDAQRIGPPVYCYAWPASPAVQGLARTVSQIQADQAGFFALLSTATWDGAAKQVAERYNLDLSDAYALLDEPLTNLLPTELKDDST